ncbi:hypothetical protein P691DRAFT_758744 [Macrolepiota fuliginosa MF-IS2]|uniref:Uncharacterized protein n=1 Tax=Macrolepiota fuliginosa MF-IS2 TaxID=1400762 RepID=A0A9P6C623_9AGAR|nr:hypothetical protein P691DRAFT_758744 [Macrolepiota fuliginosa MF-IS2]
MEISETVSYEITDYKGNKVGRLLNEGFALLPREVYAGTDDPNPIWKAEVLPKERYILSIRKAPTNITDKRLYALLERKEERAEWWLVPRFEMGEGLFQVKDSASRTVWTVPAGQHPVQIALQPSQAKKTEQLFKFTRVESSEV